MSKENIILNKLLSQVTTRNASELHLTVGEYPFLRVDDKLGVLSDQDVINDIFVKSVAASILTKEQQVELNKVKSLSMVYAVSDRLRFKVHLFFQKGTLAATFRVIPERIPELGELGMPKIIERTIVLEKGLVLVAGPFGSGKSTSVAAMVEYLNKNKNKRILTLEKPIEHLFMNNKCVIEQRDVGLDTISFERGLKDCLVEDVDVLVISEVASEQSLEYVLELVESGRLVILQVETDSTEKVVDKLMGFFPDDKKNNISLRLSETLAAVIVQRLLPRIGGGRIAAFEVLVANNPVKTLIKEGRISQLNNLIASSRAEGMVTMDIFLAELVKTNEILISDAIKFAAKPDNLKNLLNS